MTDIEGAHLRAAAATGRGHGEAHLVVDIHEGQRARGIGTGTRHIGTARSQRGEFVADATARFQREAGLVHLVEDVVHRVFDGARHSAVDGGGGRLVLERAGVRGDAACGDRTAAQRPKKTLVPVFTLGRCFDIGQRPGDTLVGVVHGLVDGCARLGDEAVFLVPDVERSLLERDGIDVVGDELDDAVHARCSSRRMPWIVEEEWFIESPAKKTTPRLPNAPQCFWPLSGSSPTAISPPLMSTPLWRGFLAERHHTQDVVSTGEG